MTKLDDGHYRPKRVVFYLRI